MRRAVRAEFLRRELPLRPEVLRAFQLAQDIEQLQLEGIGGRAPPDIVHALCDCPGEDIGKLDAYRH